MEKVSIIIPTYKGAKRLEKLFTSMRESNLINDQDCEVVASDDGSPLDDFLQTKNTCASFGFSLLHVDQNYGWISAVNHGISQATGSIILLMDDDTLFPKDLLVVLRKLMSSIESLGVLSWRSYGTNPGQSTNPHIGFLQLATQLAGYCMAFRKGIWTKIGGFDPRFHVYCGDSDFALRSTLAGFPSYRVWWPLVPHEEHRCFDMSPELKRNDMVNNDLVAFYEKWGANGEEMEARALAIK